jgi:hypothetical protein
MESRVEPVITGPRITVPPQSSFFFGPDRAVTIWQIPRVRSDCLPSRSLGTMNRNLPIKGLNDGLSVQPPP